MSIEELRTYHVEAARKMHNYAEDDRLRPSDVKHYSKRAEFHEGCVVVIDSLTPPSRQIDLGQIDLSQRLDLARGRPT